MLNCGDGLKIAERNGQWGIVDADGTDVIAPRYRAIACFSYGVAWAPIDTKGAWCALGPDGNLRPATCRTRPYSQYPNFQTHAEPETFHADPYENSVLWTRAFLEFSVGLRDTAPRWIPWRDRPSSSFR